MSNVHKLEKLVASRAISAELDAVEELDILKHGGGGGTSGGMTPSMKDYVDARDAQNLSEMKSEFEKMRADLSKLPTTWVMVGLFVSAVSLILGALAFGGTRFNAGMSMADVRQAQLQRDEDQDQAVKQINEKLDELIAAQQAPRTGRQ